MTKVMLKVLVLVALVVTPSVSADWSWSSDNKETKKEIKETPKNEEIPPTVDSKKEDVSGRSSYISTNSVPQEVLPIEEHDTFVSESVDSGVINEEGRSGRGISSKLCKLGLKGMCESPKGYPPTTYNQYNSAYVQNTPYVPNKVPYPYPTPQAKPKPFSKFIKDIFKADKKQGYVAPPPVYNAPPKSYGAPKPKPSYYAPPPSGTYGAPKPQYPPRKPSYPAAKPHYSSSSSYTPPKPTYSSPPFYTPPKPSYPAPPVYKPPVYTPPKSHYKPPKAHNTYSAPKPVDIIPHKFHKTVQTHVVKPAAVQHVHTHTHIYGGSSNNNHGYAKKSSIDDAYQASHVSTSVTNGFGAKVKPIEVVNGNVDNQIKRHIGQTPPNTFNVLKAQPTIFHTSSGSKVDTSFQGSNSFTGFNAGTANGFQAGKTNQFNAGNAQGFQVNGNKQFQTFHTGANAQGFQQGGVKTFIATPVNNKQQASFSNTFNSAINNGYAVDCQCVPAQYCSINDLVARSNPNDISHLLDARNQGSDVLSNGTTSEDYYNYDLEYDEVTTEEIVTSDDEEITTELPTSTTEIPSTSTTTTIPERKRRDVKEEETKKEETKEGLEGRQLSGYTPGLGGCNVGHVCCRRPVYTSAKRSPPTCGKGNPGIHGRVTSFDFEKGQSDFGEYPWQAAILRNEGAESMFVCGATLIDDRHLLTAAHCINDLNANVLKVRLGEWDVNRDTEFYKHVEIPVGSTVIHPEFYKGNLYNDIAIIRLVSPVDIYTSPHISPICLPPSHKDFTNARCHVTGWGKNAFGDNGKFQHILKELELSVVNRHTCQNALQGTRLGRNYKLHDGFICAGGEGGKDACKGDGGGPLMCKSSDNTYQLAGIVSWGVGCGQAGVPGVYVNIPYYVNWIQSTIRV